MGHHCSDHSGSGIRRSSLGPPLKEHANLFWNLHSHWTVDKLNPGFGPGQLKSLDSTPLYRWRKDLTAETRYKMDSEPKNQENTSNKSPNNERQKTVNVVVENMEDSTSSLQASSSVSPVGFGNASEIRQPPYTKRRRSDHNEIERRRREIQRDRIEELRMVLPGSSSSSRLSTVNIVVRAKEYIEALRSRVADLESILAHYHPERLKITQQQQSGLGTGRAVAAKPLAPKVPEAAHPAIIVAPRPFVPLPSFTIQQPKLPIQQLSQSQPQPKSVPERKKSLTPTEEEHLKRKILDYFRSQRLLSTQSHISAQRPADVVTPPFELIQENGLHAIAEAITASSETSSKRDSGNSFNKSSDSELRDRFINRRKSSLLFSSGSGVFWNHRASSFTPELGSMFPIEESLHLDIRCEKCQRGIDNLIMIDCEKCKLWYHLRCVNISPEAIPLTWTCPEC